MNLDQFDGHTPGPWYLNTPDPDPPRTVRFISDVCTDLLGATDADARLIAAAPELLAALIKEREENARLMAWSKEGMVDRTINEFLKERKHLLAEVKRLREEVKDLRQMLSFYEPPEGFGWDSQHPRYSIEDWMDCLRRGNGRPGYWEWVNYQIDTFGGEQE